MATTTPAFQIPVPTRPDPADITEDLLTSFSKVDSVLSQTSGIATDAAADAEVARRDAAAALSNATAAEFPLHIGPEEPPNGEVLWMRPVEGTTPPVDPEPVENGVGYVGALTDQSPYTALSVTGVDDAYEMVGYDITATGGGTSMVARLQGDLVPGTPGVGPYQRLEEITVGGFEACPRSNLEYAFQLYETTTSTSGSRFVPYHGISTEMEARDATYRTLTGAAVTMPAIGQTTSLPDGLVVDQVIDGSWSPSTPAQVRIETVTAFHPDGMIEVTGTWTALRDVKVGSVYGPMVPFQQSVMTSLEHAGGTVTLDTSAPATTTNVDLPVTLDSGVLKAASRPDLRIAWAWTNPSETLRRTEPDRKTAGSVIFVQRRTDGINKVYPHVWQPDTVVSAGETWTFGAQYRYMEVV